MEKKFDENGGFVMPKMTIMAPTVINENGPSESVSSKEIYTEYESAEIVENSRPVSHDPEDELNIEPRE